MTGVAAALVIGVAGSVVVGLQTPPAAHAVGTPIMVVDGACTLSDAILAVNQGATEGSCVNDPGDPTDTIRIVGGSGSGTYKSMTFPGVSTPWDLADGPVIGGGTTAYPTIKTDIIIEGFGIDPAITDRLSIMMATDPLGVGTTRAFHIDSTGSLTLRNLNLLGFGVAGEGTTLDVAGGAIYAEGPLVLDHVTVAGNSATGQRPPSFNSTRSPGDALGGAIYSNSTVTATSSVFTDNRVTGSAARPPAGFEWVELGLSLYRFSRDPNRNPDGARGGNALGADVALGPDGTFVATDSAFLSSRAYGGNGSPGEIDSGVSWSLNGARGMDGADGSDGSDRSCNAAEDGADGEAGADGSNGGAAGHATGVIYGGASVTLEHSSIVDALAIGGGAGKAGPPGIGGDGGDGGNAGTCDFFAYSVPGEGGDGGNGGDNGTPALAGTRAAAVATIESTDHVTLTNTTIVASKAYVSADITTPAIEAAIQRVNTLVGQGGSGGNGTGSDGVDGVDGDSDGPVALPGGTYPYGIATGLLSDGASRLAVSSSTIADVILDGGGDNLPLRTITQATGNPAEGDGAIGSIFWNPGPVAASCMNMRSAGFNLGQDCPVVTVMQPTDLFITDRPIAGYPVPIGAALRPPLDPALPSFRTFVMPLPVGSQAIDAGSFSLVDPGCFTPGASAPTILDDARHQPRENRCDAGSYEVDSTPAALEVDVPETIWVNDRFGGMQTLVIIGPGTTLGADATLTVTTDLPGVHLSGPAGWNPATGEMPIDENKPLPQYIAFQISADTGSAPGPVTVTAALDPGGVGAGTLSFATDTADIRDDSRLEVTSPQPAEADTCSILDLTYVATNTGRSQAPDREITLWPQMEIWNRLRADGDIQQYIENVLIGDDTTTMFTNGQVVTRRAQVDLGGGLSETFDFPPVMVRPITEYLSLSFSGVPFDGADYVMLPGQTLQVTTGLRNANPISPCGMINGVSSVRVIGLGEIKQLLDSGEQTSGVEIEPDTGAADWRSWGGPLTAPMEPGRYRFWWELVIPGLDQPLIISQQFVVQAVGVGVTPKTLESDEGDAGTSTRDFEITLDTAANADVSVDWTTADDTATAGTDYEAASGTVTFAPGETSKTVSVTVTGDKAVEGDENFLVRLTPPAGGLGGGARIELDVAATQITNDDVPLPSFSLDDVTVTEGNSGTTTLTFTVQADAPVGVGGAQLQLTSSDDTATAGDDYVALDVPVDFAEGDETAAVSVTINGDLLDESDESFDVELTGPVPLTGRLTATGTITDDDTAQASAATVLVTEGSGGGTTSAVVTFALSTPADHTVTVDVATSLADGTAQADDFVATTGTVTFPAGSVQQQFTVQLVADSQPETNEFVAVLLSNPTGGTLATQGMIVQIADDDPWTVTGPVTVNVTEGNPSDGPRTVQVTATLNAPAPGAGLLVEFVTLDGTAQAGKDYVARSGTLTIPAGETTAMVEIELINDLTRESTETFSVVFSTLRFVQRPAALAGIDDTEAVFGNGAMVTVSITDNDVSRGIPATGGNTLPWAQLAGAAVWLGIVLTFIARRRRHVGSLDHHV